MNAARKGGGMNDLAIAALVVLAGYVGYLWGYRHGSQDAASPE